MSYALRETLAAFRRAPFLTFLSVVLIGFSLYVVGLFGLTAYNIHLAIERIAERVEVVAYLRDDTGERQRDLAAGEMRRMPEVLELRYVSKLEALATARREMEEFRELFTGLESNPLPASFEVRLRPGSRTPEAAARVARYLEAYPFVEEVSFGRDWLDKIVFLRGIAGGAALVIGVAFAAVAAIIIATAVRIAVFARREEISIMRLVGATNGFIRHPFLLEGAVTGVLGGALAAGLTYASYRLINAFLIELAWLPPEWAAAGVAAGGLFGFLASGVAVRRHLKAV
ncbi:MAG: cell division protein FtsX [Longimicrobiaceae bacterium]